MLHLSNRGAARVARRPSFRGRVSLISVIIAGLFISACSAGFSPMVCAQPMMNAAPAAAIPEAAPAIRVDRPMARRNAGNDTYPCVKAGECVKWETAERQAALKKRDQQEFVEVKVGTINSLHRFLPTARFDEAVKILDQAPCNRDALSVYMRKKGLGGPIVVLCPRSDATYPTVLTVNASRTREITLDYGFMYDTGGITAITDVNGDGHVEFWVSGTTSECEEGCQPGETEGTAVLEETEDGLCVRAIPDDFQYASVGYLDGKGSAALLSGPGGIASDGTNLYVADTGNNRIRKIALATGAVTTLAGSSTTCAMDGTGKAAAFNGPQGIVFTGGNLYVADTLNNKIRRIELSTGRVTTLAGSGNKGSVDGVGMGATFNQPYGIATDGKNLYVTDSFSNKIRKVEIASGSVTTLAGSGRFDTRMMGAGPNDGCNDGVGTAASLCHPTGITIFDGNLYVVDQGNPRIRKVNIISGAVTTVAGSGRYGKRDGVGPSAEFSGSTGITTDGHYLFVADSINFLRKIDISTGKVSSLTLKGAYQIPTGILAMGGNLYVTGSAVASTVEKIDSANRVTTIAGFEPGSGGAKPVPAARERTGSDESAE